MTTILPASIRTVALGGVGLMGGSLGLRLRALPSPPRVVAFGRTEATLARAKERGAVDAFMLDPAEAVRDADLVVLSAPVRAIPPLFTTLAPHLKDGAVVTDVGSTKGWIVAEAERRLPERARFVGSHPMCGSERDGIEHATAALYEKAVTVVVPSARTDDAALRATKALWESVGSITLTLPAALHDRIVASISHLPHVLASLLVNTVALRSRSEVRTWDLAAGGFRDTTRIASGSPEIWRDICLTNRTAILDAVRDARAEIDGFLSALDASDEEALNRFFAGAKETRDAIPPRGAALLPALHDLYVAIADRPGTIHEVTGVLGEAGLNIVDLELPRGPEGAGDAPLRIFFESADSRERARALLEARGFATRGEP